MNRISILIGISMFLSYVWPLKLSSQIPGNAISFTYNINSDCRTSAGVYAPDSTLVRTLWSGEPRTTGLHTANWDGKDDIGNLLPNGNFYIKVLTNNVTYTWEGVVGNTSQAFTGSTVHYAPTGYFKDMCIVNGRATYVAEYFERQKSDYAFNTNNMQVKLDVWPPNVIGTPIYSNVITTDGNYIYFGGSMDENQQLKSFIYARNASTNAIINFPMGVPFVTGKAALNGQLFKFDGVCDTASVQNTNFFRITGLAVQKTGDYLFVTRSKLNSVHVLNKTTGQLLYEYTFSQPDYIATDVDGNIWIANSSGCKKYTVNSNGTINTTATLTLTGLSHPAGVKVTPDGSKVYVADGGTSQQVKIFNNTTGVLMSTFGQAGGYVTNPVVTYDRFMFRDGKNFDTLFLNPNNEYASICFDPADNSWWLLDAGNQRNLHFSQNNVLIETFMAKGYHYSVQADANNPARLFADYLEYEIDYTKPLAPNNGSWKLVKNWSNALPQGATEQLKRIYSVTTLNNGRTYALNGLSGYRMGVVELTNTGMRYTGQEFPFPQRPAIQKDGSLWKYDVDQSGLVTWKKQALTGFDGNNNPVWANPVIVASTNIYFDTTVQNNPAGFGFGQQLTDGTITYFNNEKSGGFHLAAIKPGSNKWLWKTSTSTHYQYRGAFPDDGAYDLGNYVQNPGGSMQCVENNIFWTYKGEFWKGSQANKINHFYKNGLFLGQCGTTGPDVVGNPAAAEMAGNNTSAPIVKVGNDYYLYHNDESYHSGTHRWRISGLNTIQEQSIGVVKSGTPPPLVYDYKNLMEGLPSDDTLTNNTAGWTRFAPESGNFSVKTNYGTYKKFANDIRIFSIGQNVDCWVKRELGNNTGLLNWKITGELSYPEAGEYGDNFMEVLDANDRIIVRISRPEFAPNLEIKANARRIAFGPDVYDIVGRLRPLSIVANGDSVTVSFAIYNPVTVGVLNPQADIHNPTTLRFYTVSQPSGHQVNVANLKFYKNSGPVPNHFRSKATGLWKNAGTWQSSPDSTTWADATAVPDSSANSIAIYNGHIVALTDTVTVDQLTVQANSGLKVAPNALLKISDGPGSDITVAGSASMLIQSDATGTGRIGYSTGTVSGNVTVERYISANNNKAYRLLAPTVNTAGGPKPYIRSNWQEGQNNSSILANSNTVPNYGIHITGSMMGANGFDATLAATPSLLYFNQAATIPAWMPVANTDATSFDVKKGYLVYVRGDRSTDLHNNTNSSNTTLRTTGTIVTGTQTFTNLESNGRNSLVTNPYPCPVDWSVIYNDPTTSNAANFENYYTYWDPNMGLSGGYVTVNANGTKSAATNATTEIQPGQAFFVKAKAGVAAPVFTIKESHKSGTSNINVFRTGAREQFRTALYFMDANGVRKMADAVNAVFDTAFSASVDGNDAEEMANWDENVGITRASKMFSIEGRPLIDVTDTVQLIAQRLKVQNYEWQFEPMGFAQPNMKAYLEDKYTNQRLQMNLTGITVVPFTVTGASASAAPDRFRVVFAPNSSLPITMRSLKAYQKGTGIEVTWVVNNEDNVERYEVEKSLDGRNFIKSGTVLANATGSAVNTYNWFDQQPKEGNNYYRIKTIDKNGTVSYSAIVNVKLGSQKGNFEVYPNPLEGNYLTVQFNSVAKGTYTVNFMNAIGQKIISRIVNHSGGSASQTIRMDNSLPPGNYTLQVTGEGISFIRKIVK